MRLQPFRVVMLRVTALSTLALLAVSACQRGLRSIAPMGLAPTEPSIVREWVAPYQAASTLRYDLHWAYQNDRGAAKGRASVRIAPPDSLRFDFRGPFGRSGAAVVIGDSGIWSRPEGDFHDLLRAAPLFWAAMGMPSAPSTHVSVSSLETAQRRAWRYAGVTDTFDFVQYREPPQRILGEMRRGGRIIGLSEADFDRSGRLLISSRIDFPGAETRFTFSVDSISRTGAFGADTWVQP